MQARQCWSVLADKAEDECSRIQQELNNIQQRLDGLRANERRLQQLYAEYNERLSREGQAMNGMQDAINQRQFMYQITKLIEKVHQDQSITVQAMVQARTRLTEALREKLKMQGLMENDLQRQRSAEKIQDQKNMDELALRQFHVRQMPGHA